MPKKLFEIRYGEWEKALSVETSDFVDGVFRTFSNCDPFSGRGSFTPTAAITELGNGTINVNKVIRAILPVYTGDGANFFYVLADDYKLYKSDLTTVTDVSSQIASGTATAKDLAIWKAGLVYVMSSEVRYNAIPVASGSDLQILSCVPTSNFCVGPDGYGYVGISNNVGKFTVATGTAGNTTSVAASLESNNKVKKLISAGRYLVWIADNYDAQPSGTSVITVAYWNLAASVFDDIQYFQGGQIAGAELLPDGFIKILTSTGIYVTKFGMGQPQLIVPFGGTVAVTDIPSIANKAVCIHKRTFFMWAGGTKVYGYGNNVVGKPNRLFQSDTGTASITALASNNTNLLIGSGSAASVKLHWLRGSGSLNTAIANVASFSLQRPFAFHSARVITKNAISAGNSVSLQILTADSAKTIKASETKTNSTDPGERNLVFDHTSAGDGSDVARFDDISDVKLTTNVAVNSLEIWGEPVSERSSYG